MPGEAAVRRLAARRERTALAGYAALALSAVSVVAFLADVGGQPVQVLLFRLEVPALSLIAVLLYRRAARRHPRGSRPRRYWHLMQGAAGSLATANGCALVIALAGPTWEFPLSAAPVRFFNIVTAVLAVGAMLAVPVRRASPATHLRLGLDIVIVLLSAMTFMWYWSIAPTAARGSGAFTLALIVVQAGVLLVVVFVVARLLLAGSAGVRPVTLAMFGGACVVEAVREALAALLSGPAHLHLLIAAGMVFYFLIIAAPLVELTATTDGTAGDVRRRRPFSVLPYLAIAATKALLVVALLSELDVRTWGVLAGAVALTALVVGRQTVALRDNARLLERLDHSLAVQRQATTREQVLAETGTALMGIPDRQAIYQLAVDAAVTMLGEFPGTRAMVSAVAPGPAVKIMAGAGDRAAETLGVRITETGAGAEVYAQLRAGRVVECGPADLGLDMIGTVPVKQGTLVLLPLTAGDDLVVLSVANDGPLPTDVRKSLETLRTQVALAVESAALVARLAQQALHDELTGLANRAAFHQRLQQAVQRSGRSGTATAVLMLDLDGFKQVNDTLGHAAGDQLLRVVADRLGDCLRGHELAARLGGDEFAVVVEDLSDPRQATVVAERISTALAGPTVVDGHQVSIRGSIGVAVCRAGDTDVDRLVREADGAMYRAKRRTRTHRAGQRAAEAGMAVAHAA